ncbi:DUF7426 family protein [Actinomadura gamaensis]|uniref:DUF7426 domain-containing protein n=1 Tax=Actinomadura gamaensis TaxID=1763541 RepID=A0ABV9UC44_9ACTN
MAFKDLNEFLADAHLDLPINGTVYRVNDPDAETGLVVQRLMEIGAAVHQGREVTEAELDDVEEGELYERVLGDAYAQMLADNVTWSRIKHAAVTAMIWISADLESAEKYWETAGEATAPPATPAGPNRASRRASAAAARTTRSRASTTGTRASRSTTRKPSPGRKSSASGS